MGWKETRLFKAFTGPRGMKELRPCRKTQQRPPKDAASSGSVPPNRPIGLTMPRSAPPGWHPDPRPGPALLIALLPSS